LLRCDDGNDVAFQRESLIIDCSVGITDLAGRSGIASLKRRHGGGERPLNRLRHRPDASLQLV
jgi:hypothetical protein